MPPRIQENLYAIPSELTSLSNGESLTLRDDRNDHNDMAFYINKQNELGAFVQEEVVKIQGGTGDIFIRGRLIGKDVELVNGLRDFLSGNGGANLPHITEEQLKGVDYTNIKNKMEFINGSI